MFHHFFMKPPIFSVHSACSVDENKKITANRRDIIKHSERWKQAFTQNRFFFVVFSPSRMLSVYEHRAALFNLDNLHNEAFRVLIGAT